MAAGLQYRDFITVGVLLRRGRDGLTRMHDNWIYVQEPDVRVGRLQIFNNWSPYLVADPETVWVGMEYFASEGDELWSRSDAELAQIAVAELGTLGLATAGEVLDTTVLRAPKAYPAYFGTYDQLATVREYLDAIDNLFVIGRNGMHRYNNQDHSMLTAMVAVANIADGRVSKDNIWSVNVEQEYHETASSASAEAAPDRSPSRCRRFRARVDTPVAWTAAVSALAVIYIAFVVPLGRAPDEAEHAFRAFQIASGGLLSEVIRCATHPRALPCTVHYPGPYVPGRRVGGTVPAGLYDVLEALGGLTRKVTVPPFDPHAYARGLVRDARRSAGVRALREHRALLTRQLRPGSARAPGRAGALSVGRRPHCSRRGSRAGSSGPRSAPRRSRSRHAGAGSSRSRCSCRPRSRRDP